jgi:hypothetical protein
MVLVMCDISPDDIPLVYPLIIDPQLLIALFVNIFMALFTKTQTKQQNLAMYIFVPGDTVRVAGGRWQGLRGKVVHLICCYVKFQDIAGFVFNPRERTWRLLSPRMTLTAM